MISGALYSKIYILVLTVITIGLTFRYSFYTNERVLVKKTESPIYSLVLMVVLILWIGFRPLHSAFVDMFNYTEMYGAITNYKDYNGFDSDSDNLIFSNLFTWMAYEDFDIEYFFLVIATIYFTCIWFACRLLFPNDTLYAFVIYLSAFSTFSYATNGIKAGAAAAIFLVAIALRNRNLWLCVLFALLSWGFHHSMYVSLAVFALTFFVRNPKIYLWFWFFCIVLSAIKFNPFSNIMTELADDSSMKYLDGEYGEDWGGKIGFRLDFLIYSAVPIAIGCYTIFKLKIKDAFYNFLFNLYTGINAIWVLCMYIPFNNRIAYLSWCMLPIVSIYPMLRLNMQYNQYRLLNGVVWVYLLFTLYAQFSQIL